MFRTAIFALSLTLLIAGDSYADEIRGKVSSVDTAKKTVVISGVSILADDAWIEDERDYPLTLEVLKNMGKDAYIEVSGKFTGPSEMKAKKIDQRVPECAVIEGKIASIDAAKKEIVISGIIVKVKKDAWLEGPGRVKIPLELFTPGYPVECRGEWTGNSEFTAFKVAVD